MKIRSIKEKDRYEWLRLRTALWRGRGGLSSEVARYFAGELYGVSEVFVVDRGGGRLGGFLELNIRDYAEGSDEPRVPFVEGWFVDADLRGQGWGRALMEQAEAWAIEHGLHELASETMVEDADGQIAYISVGYYQVARKVSFIKPLRVKVTGPI